MRRAPAWVAALAVGLPGLALGHDIPNARIDRGTQVVVATGRLRVEYEVSLAELTLAQDLRQLDGESFAGDRAALFDRYARVAGPLNACGLLVRVDAAEVELTPVGFEVRVEDHPRFLFRFEAAIADRGRLALDDTNYASSEGTTRLACRAEAGVRLAGDLPPPDLGRDPDPRVGPPHRRRGATRPPPPPRLRPGGPGRRPEHPAAAHPAADRQSRPRRPPA